MGCVGMVLSCAGCLGGLVFFLKGLILCGDRAGYVRSVREWYYPVRRLCCICAKCVWKGYYHVRKVCGISAGCLVRAISCVGNVRAMCGAIWNVIILGGDCAGYVRSAWGWYYPARGVRGEGILMFETCVGYVRSLWEGPYPARGMCGICATCVGMVLSSAERVCDMCEVGGKGIVIREKCVGYVRTVWAGYYHVRRLCGIFAGCSGAVLSCSGSVWGIRGVCLKGLILRGGRVAYVRGVCGHGIILFGERVGYWRIVCEWY